MHFTIDKDIFVKALARVQGIVEKRNTIPILSNVLIDAKADTILLTATDLEVGMQSSYPASVSEQGQITVSAKKLYEIIKELPEQEVSFTAKDNCWIEIRCGKSLFNIVGLSPEEFPYFPTPAEENFVQFQSTLLRDMIDRTAYAISTDESKYNLNGIFFKNIGDDERKLLRLVATDGHRLSLVQREIEASTIPELEKGVIFPRKGVLELKKMADDGEEDILLGFLDNSAIIRKNTTTVVMRLVDGEFPDYNRVIPKENNLTAVIPNNTFVHALRRISILSNEKSKGIKLQLRDGSLEISSSNPELGDAKEDFDINYNGPEMAIGFNARYLIDILNFQMSDTIEMHIKDNLSPGLICPAGEKDTLAVIMPMRL